MTVHSAGVVMYRHRGELEVFLVRPGGPYWARRDAASWSIPKGLVEPGEDALAAARRELFEETGAAPGGPFLALGPFRQPRGKIVHAFATEADFDPAALASNVFAMEWPPRSGRRAEFPEVDRGGWFGPATAREKILKGQKPILDALDAALG